MKIKGREKQFYWRRYIKNSKYCFLSSLKLSKINMQVSETLPLYYLEHLPKGMILIKYINLFWENILKLEKFVNKRRIPFSPNFTTNSNFTSNRTILFFQKSTIFFWAFANSLLSPKKFYQQIKIMILPKSLSFFSFSLLSHTLSLNGCTLSLQSSLTS